MWRIVHKETGKVIKINKGFYQSRAVVIRALKTSRVLTELGLVWADVHLVDYWGRTMDELTSVAVSEGLYALRHREGWYWQQPRSQKVWYSSAAALDRAWAVNEKHARQIEDRKPFADPGKQGFQLVQGLADGEVKVYPCRY